MDIFGAFILVKHYVLTKLKNNCFLNILGPTVMFKCNRHSMNDQYPVFGHSGKVID